MKFRLPPVEIDPQQPFKDAFFQRGKFADSLTALFRNSSEGMVVFVNAPWGAGKTTFLRMWEAKMKLDGLPCITFDAYASDYVLDPFVAFSGEIIELLKNRRDELAGVEPLTRSFRDAAVAVAKQGAPLLANLAIRAATAGVLGAAELKTVADAVSSAGEEIASTAAKAVEQQIENYQKEKETLAHFRTKLAEVAKLVWACLEKMDGGLGGFLDVLVV